MKTKLSILATIVAITLTSTPMFGQQPIEVTPTPVVPSTMSPPVSLPMIRNLGVLKDFAEQQVRQGAISLDSVSMLPGGQRYYNTPNPLSGMEDVLNSLRSWQASCQVANTSDPVTVRGDLWDTNGYTYFSFNKSVPLAYNGDIGSYWLTVGFQFGVVPNVPIPMPGIDSAIAVVRQAGATNSVWIRAENGYIFYPTNLTERTGELLLTFRYEDRLVSAAYAMSDRGTQLPLSNVAGYVGLGVEGDYNFGRNPENVGLFGVDLRGAVVHFEIATPPGTIRSAIIGGQSNTGEIPIGVLIRAEESLNYSYLPAELVPGGLGTGNARWNFGSAKWTLIYVMSQDLDNVPIDNWPVGKDGGMGIVGAP